MGLPLRAGTVLLALAALVGPEAPAQDAGRPPASADAARRTKLRPLALKAAADRWVLQVGSPADKPWLYGDWHASESAAWPWNLPQVRRRWTGARPGIYLPTRPGAPYRVRMAALVPEEALLKGGSEIRVNGKVVGKITGAGLVTLEARVPAAVLGQDPVAALELRVGTFVPGGKQKDTRALGITVRQVEWLRGG